MHFTEMVAGMESAGMADIEAYMTEVYFNRLALWGVEPTAVK